MYLRGWTLIGRESRMLTEYEAHMVRIARVEFREQNPRINVRKNMDGHSCRDHKGVEGMSCGAVVWWDAKAHRRDASRSRDGVGHAHSGDHDHGA